MSDAVTPEPSARSRLGRRETIWLLGALVLVAFLVRAWGIGAAPYQIDEATLSLKANQLGHLTQFHAVGIRTSFGFHNPPLFVWMMAPFFSVTPDPRFAGVGIALMGAVAVGLAGLAARGMWGNWAALGTAAVLAFSPNAIEHSRRLWGHDTITFWTALCAFCAVRGIQRGRAGWLVASMGAAAGAQACHLSGVFLWLMPVGALLLFRPARAWLTFAGGLGVALLIYLPWIISDARGIGEGGEPFGQMRAIVATAVGGAGAEVRPEEVPPLISWSTVLADGGHSDLFSSRYPEWITESPSRAGLHRLLTGLAVGLVLGGIALTAAKWRLRERFDDSDRRWAVIILAASIAPLAVFSPLRVEIVPPYMLPALVPQALLAGWLVALLRSAVARRWPDPAAGRLAAGLLMAAFVVPGAALAWEVRTAFMREEGRPAPTVLLHDRIEAAAHIFGAGMNIDYAIMQDGRAPEAFIDLATAYLHFVVSGDSQPPLDPGATAAFVLVNSNVVLRSEVAPFLADRPGVAFGPLTVYELHGADAAQWRALVRTYSSAARSN